MSNSKGDQLLYSKEAEESIIGSLLVDYELYDLVGLPSKAFYNERLRIIYEVIGLLIKKNIAIDIVTLSEHPKAKSYDIDPAYLVALINATPSTLHVESYSKVVRDYYNRRIIAKHANNLVKIAFDIENDVEYSLSPILQSLTNNLDTGYTLDPISKYNNDFLIKLNTRMESPTKYWGFQTGFKELDDITGGIQRKETFIVAGAPSTGKSTLATQIGFNMALGGNPGAIFSLEMSGFALIRRLISWLSEVKTYYINSGYISDSQYSDIIQDIDKLNKLPIWISDSSRWTTLAIRSQIAKMQIHNPLSWIVIDYANLLMDNLSLSQNDRTASISLNLKSIAKEFNIALIVIYAYNKQGIRGDLNIANLSGSGKTSYDADIVLHLVKKENNITQCLFGKGRELVQDKLYFELYKDPNFPAFSNMPMEDNHEY